MDTVGTLTSIALQYGVPLESLVKKFAYSAVRTERVHKKSGHSPCDEHHRLRVPLARVPVHQRLQGSDCAESRATRSTAQRNSRHREESTQSAGHRSRAHRRQGSDRRHHRSSVQSWKRWDVWTAGNGNGAGTSSDRVTSSAWQHLHGHHLFRVRQRQSHSRRRLRRLHRMRHEPGL